jgi:hypothetical protein
MIALSGLSFRLLRARRSAVRGGAVALVAVALFMDTSSAVAQSAADVSITAFVAGDVWVRGLSDLDFGDVTIGGGTLAAGLTHVIAPDDEAAAQFEARGAFNDFVSVRISGSPEGLMAADPDVSHALPFRLILRYSGGSGNNTTRCTAAGAAVWDGGQSNAQLKCRHDGEARGQGGRGSAYVWVGGEIDVASDAVPGLYSAEIVLEAEF